MMYLFSQIIYELNDRKLTILTVFNICTHTVLQKLRSCYNEGGGARATCFVTRPWGFKFGRNKFV